MNLLTIEINQGNGWYKSWSEDVLSCVTIDEIACDVRVYANATNAAHRANLNGVVVAAYDPAQRRVIGQIRSGT